MRIIYLFIGLLFLSFSLQSQNPAEVPNIFPASPEASTLGRFGEVPVNSSVGMASFSVPIYTINEGNFSLPISINYQHNGLVVNQIPGHLGMGWNLNAGGMITRQVRSRPDDNFRGYIGEEMQANQYVIPYVFNTISVQDEVTLREGASQGWIDTQPDKFVLSVGSMYATFYFDENRNIMISPYKPYQITPTFINDKITKFEVIDDKGVKYVFEDEEETRREPPTVPGENLATPIFDWYTSGWKLTEVTTVSNRTIAFQYDDVVFYQRVVSENYKERVYGTCAPASGYSRSERYYGVKSKLIKEITFPKGKLIFNNTLDNYSLDVISNFNRFRSRLDKIELRDPSNNLINEYNLTYDFANKTRKLLEEIKINNDNTNTYSFEYEGVPDDNINTAKQDFWGYYNSNPTTSLIDHINFTNLYANRQPDFSKSVIGSLKKITYPTKGITEIEYEANTFNPDNAEIPYNCASATTNNSVSEYVYLNWQQQQAGDNYNSATHTITIAEPYLYVDVFLEVEKRTEPTGPNNQPDGSIYGAARGSFIRNGAEWPCFDLECYGENPPAQYVNKLGCESIGVTIGSPTDYSAGKDTRRRRLKLHPGEYTFFLEVENFGVAFDTGDILTARGTIKFYEDDGTPPPKSIETGGHRVSKIKNCPDINPDNCIITEYIYETDEGVSLGNLFRKRNITSYDETFDKYDCQSTLYRNHSSNSNVPLSFFMGSHVYYNDVIEKQISNSEQAFGYKKQKFIFPSIPQNETFPFLAKDHNEYKHGKISKLEIFDNNDQPLKSTDYNYSFSTNLNGINQQIYSIAFGLTSTIVSYTNELGDIHQYFYDENVTFFENQHDVDYLIGLVNKNWQDGSLVETETLNTYTNPQGHLKTREVTDSDGSLYKTEYTYPYEDPTTINNLLVAENRIAMPIEEEAYKEGVLLTRSKTIYNNFLPGIIEPENIEIQKGSNILENRLIYHKYDSYGNPLDVAQADGTRIAYIWGYSGEYPVAKIENKSYDAIPVSLRNAIVSSSINGTETQLQTALDNLRNDPSMNDAMVTTITYKPLIGVSTMTDSRGYTMSYEYDDLNRLKYVRDADGNIVSKNQYNYKN